MTLGQAPVQGDLLRTTLGYCEGRVAPDSVYAVLHRECFNLFPDEMFADLFTDVGRRSVPPMIVAVVMVLQRIEGCSDRIFEATLEAARGAGLVGRKRVLDSTPLYDAVATMDTVTLARSAIRGLLKAADPDLEPVLRAGLGRDDDYAGAGKPVCDWDDVAARAGLVDALAKDALAALAVLDGREATESVSRAGELLATVVGQDLEASEDGVFRIARRVARDRVISIVDPEARHGHKTSARSFDGYKGHVAIDPDSEIITATGVTAGNTGDGGTGEGPARRGPGGPDPGDLYRSRDWCCSRGWWR